MKIYNLVQYSTNEAGIYFCYRINYIIIIETSKTLSEVIASFSPVELYCD